MPLPHQCQLSDTRHTGRGYPTPAKALSEGPPIRLRLSQDPTLEINSSLSPAEELEGEVRALRMKTTDNVGRETFLVLLSLVRVKRNEH